MASYQNNLVLLGHHLLYQDILEECNSTVKMLSLTHLPIWTQVWKVSGFVAFL
jgi:hypothetical protein